MSCETGDAGVAHVAIGDGGDVRRHVDEPDLVVGQPHEQAGALRHVAHAQRVLGRVRVPRLQRRNDALHEVVLDTALQRDGARGGRPDAYASRPAWFDLLSSILKPRTTHLGDVVEKARFRFEGAEPTYDEKSVQKNLAKEGARDVLRAAHEALEALGEGDWKAAAIDAALEPLPEPRRHGRHRPPPS